MCRFFEWPRICTADELMYSWKEAEQVNPVTSSSRPTQEGLFLPSAPDPQPRPGAHMPCFRPRWIGRKEGDISDSAHARRSTPTPPTPEKPGVSLWDPLCPLTKPLPHPPPFSRHREPSAAPDPPWRAWSHARRVAGLPTTSADARPLPGRSCR